MKTFFLKVCIFLSFVGNLLASEKYHSTTKKITTIPHICVINNIIASLTIPPGETRFFGFTDTVAQSNDGIFTFDLADPTVITIHKTGHYLVRFNSDYSPLQQPTFTSQIFLQTDNGPFIGMGPLDFNNPLNEVNPNQIDHSLLNYIIKVEKEPSSLKIGITNNDSLVEKNISIQFNTETLSIGRLSDLHKTKGKSTGIPHLSAISKGGSTFNLVNFPGPQFFNFSPPDTHFGPQTIDFGETPDEILLKSPGKYLVLFNSTAFRHNAEIVLQYFLKPPNGMEEALNVFDFSTAGIDEISPYILQNIINVTEKNTTLRVGFSLSDTLFIPLFRETFIEPRSTVINVIYLGR